MHGYVIQDVGGVSKTSFIRALRSLLAANLPSMFPKLRSVVVDGLASEIRSHKQANGKYNGPELARKRVLRESRHIIRTLLRTLKKYCSKSQLFHILRTRAMSVPPCNYSLYISDWTSAKDQKFTAALAQYAQDVFKTGEMIRTMPKVFAPCVIYYIS